MLSAHLSGVVSFHGSALAYKTGDKNFTEGNPINVVIHNGYLDPANSAAQIDSIKASLVALLMGAETPLSVCKVTGCPQGHCPGELVNQICF